MIRWIQYQIENWVFVSDSQNLLWIIWINENDSGTEFRSFDGISLGSDVNLGSVFTAICSDRNNFE